MIFFFLYAICLHICHWEPPPRCVAAFIYLMQPAQRDGAAMRPRHDAACRAHIFMLMRDMRACVIIFDLQIYTCFFKDDIYFILLFMSCLFYFMLSFLSFI